MGYVINPATRGAYSTVGFPHPTTSATTVPLPCVHGPCQYNLPLKLATLRWHLPYYSLSLS